MTIRFNGPQWPDEKRRWDHMLARRDEALREVADLKAEAERSETHRAFYEDEAAHEQRIADIIGSVIPDEKTRRRPGFNVNRWRDANPVFAEISKRRAAEARKAKGRRRKPLQG